ncbi:MAG: helix-turn-helix transcriptional regulator [bacterium]|nr:helix-turn-helix transcriptional regulator [bacterium]
MARNINEVSGVGGRLKQVRHRLKYGRQEMASVLGLKISGYYKNETNETFPSQRTLYRLQRDYDISMDWLMFNKGPMIFKQKVQPQEKAPPLWEQLREVKDLLDDMEQNPQLKHEILGYYFKFKNQQGLEGVKD